MIAVDLQWVRSGLQWACCGSLLGGGGSQWVEVVGNSSTSLAVAGSASQWARGVLAVGSQSASIGLALGSK